MTVRLAPPNAARLSESALLEPIRDIWHAVIQRLLPAVAAAWLGPSTFWQLYFLDRGKERHPGELARRIGITPGACTASVDQLVELGYVLRRTSVSDRRQIELVVTPRGHRALDVVWRSFDASLRGVLEGLPPEEIVATARTLRAISGRLRHDAGAPRPELAA
jgi:DNA-binding MarR family transcriptional regulator